MICLIDCTSVSVFDQPNNMLSSIVSRTSVLKLFVKYICQDKLRLTSAVLNLLVPVVDFLQAKISDIASS